ncbi:MAG: hypothetical protein HYS14_00845 [Candidatus Rokubacteria bacterium]|nr:hypothetical protein [Candidatus Rokubacteria bacterium]
MAFDAGRIFLGSGTTAVAAIETDRQFIGIEIEKKYVSLAKRRIAAALVTTLP